MTVGELLARIDSRELSEWMAYAELEPFGQRREDYRAGVIAASNVNLWAKEGKAADPMDWFRTAADTPRFKTVEELALTAMTATAMMRGTIIHGNNRQPVPPAGSQPAAVPERDGCGAKGRQ